MTAEALAKAPGRVDYRTVRQSGSHIRLSPDRNGEHHVTVPRHHPLRVGTLSGILGDVAEHLGVERDELIQDLFG